MLTATGNSEFLEDPYDSIYLPWVHYNDKEKTTINRKIAREIDNIECLIQLCLFTKDSDNIISDAEDFVIDLKEKIKTKLGQEILRYIVDPMVDEFIHSSQ